MLLSQHCEESICSKVYLWVLRGKGSFEGRAGAEFLEAGLDDTVGFHSRHRDVGDPEDDKDA